MTDVPSGFVLKVFSGAAISCTDSNPAGGANLLPSHASGYDPSSCFSPPSPKAEAGWREEEQGGGLQGASGGSRQEVQDLKEQLEALRCQVGPPLTTPAPPPPLSISRTASKNVPSSDAIRAELMSNCCCQGRKELFARSSAAMSW